jgi:hypothetical protein
MTAPTEHDHRAAIAANLDRIKLPTYADAVRALPVIPTCGDCGWQASALSRTGAVIRVCIKSKAREIDLSAAPPSWCELRDKR